MDELWFCVIEIFIFDCKEKKKSEKWWKTFEQLGKDFWPIKRRKTGGACGQTKKWKRFMKSRTRYAGGLHSWITYKEWNKTEYPRNHPWGKGRRKRGRPRLSWLWMTWKRTKGIGCENMETGGPEHGKRLNESGCGETSALQGLQFQPRRRSGRMFGVDRCWNAWLRAN